MRCRLCDKVAYRTRVGGAKAARRDTNQYRSVKGLGRPKAHKHRMRVYKGRCGFWHLTRTKTLIEHLEKAGRLPIAARENATR